MAQRAADYKEDLIEVLKQKFDTIQEDFVTVETNFKDMDEDIASINYTLYLLVLRVLGHIKGKPVPNNTKKGPADLPSINMETIAKAGQEIVRDLDGFTGTV